MIRLLPESKNCAVFLQLYGSPVLGTPKARLLEPDAALTLDCVGIAAEVNVDGPAAGLAEAAACVERAQRMGLLTLLMVTYAAADATSLIRALAIASQLAPDFIKIGLPPVEAMADEPASLRLAMQNSPPVLMAGGKSDGEFERRLRLAKTLGFTGTCVGRNYFHEPLRSASLKLVGDVFGYA
jgi:DhnA family fructose-bisphosphate aldolase class Ia